jgi:anhydro-N-acetylmuramic acid kinase
MKHYKVIGLMSGTSLDGVDIAYCEFEFDTKWYFEIIKAETIEYPSLWKDRLSSLMNSSAETLTEIDRKYGKYLGQITKEFIIKNRVSPDFISSHGHTIFHQPDKGFTLQIGDGHSISSVTGLPVVYDFRSLDVALGGQGAPLVPIGDRLLFSVFDYCLNLGGIANISFEKAGKRLAFDICPVNMVLNYLASLEGFRFDMNGSLASTGIVNPSLLQKLNHLDYYQKNPPKSLGKEWVDCNFLPILNGDLDRNENKLRTVTEHIATQIAAIINSLPIGNMLVTGGGAKNKYLIETLKSKLSTQIVIPESQIIDFKEAMIFAFLGVLRWRNEINTLSSVTGADRDCCGGSIVMV